MADNLLDKASILLTPTAYNDGRMLSVKPNENLYGSEIVTNGGFDTGNNWSIVGGSPTINGGKLNIVSSLDKVRQSLSPFNISKVYKVEFTISNYISGGALIKISNSASSAIFSSNGTHTFFLDGMVNNALDIIGISVGGVQPNLSIDNVSVVEDLSGDFTFSRGSAATRVNAQGLVENVQIISSELVSNGDFSQIGTEEVTNGDFATDSDWSFIGTTEISGGIASFPDSTNSFLIQNFVVDLSVKNYKLTYEVVSTNGSNFRLAGGNSAFGTVTLDSATIGTKTAYLTSNGTKQNLQFNNNNFVGSIDNVSVKEVGQDWIFGTGYNMGDGKVVITNSSSSNLEQLGITITNTKKYKIDFTISDYTSGSIRPMLGSVGAVVGTYVSENGVYTETLTANNNFDRIVFRTGGTAFNGSIDNISVKEITDDTDLPRIDYTGGCGSWLLEPQSTNTVTYSEDFSQWSNISATLTSGYLAPDGTLGATKISGTIGTSNILLGSASSETATRTIWARTVSGTGTAKLMSYYQNTNNLFTLTEEWQRFELNGAIATGGLGFYVDFRDNSQTLNEFIIWGAQSEALSYATSYIPTNGATNTRLQDIATNSGNASLINSTEGVLYAEISALADNTTNQRISLSYDNQNFVRIEISNSQIVFAVYNNGAYQVNTNYIVSDITDFNKIAVKYKENDFALWVNGTEVRTDTSGLTSFSSPLDHINFSNANGGGSFFYGKTKALAVYKEALTDAELQSLTTI